MSCKNFLGEHLKGTESIKGKDLKSLGKYKKGKGIFVCYATFLSVTR